MGDQELSSEHVQICVDMSTKSWTIVNFRKPCDLTMVWFSPMHWIFSKVPRFKGTCESICFEDSQDSLIIAVGFISQAVGCTPLWNFVITKCRSCTFSHWTWWSNIHNYIYNIYPPRPAGMQWNVPPFPHLTNRHLAENAGDTSC